MTYSESAEGIEISKRRALIELARHYKTDPADIVQFFTDLGERDTYTATEVLTWLGY